MIKHNRKIYSLQSDILKLGVKFVDGTKDQLGDDNYRNIKAYFDANEYGEALSQINCLASTEAFAPEYLVILEKKLTEEVEMQFKIME